MKVLQPLLVPLLLSLPSNLDARAGIEPRGIFRFFRYVFPRLSPFPSQQEMKYRPRASRIPKRGSRRQAGRGRRGRGDLAGLVRGLGAVRRTDELKKTLIEVERLREGKGGELTVVEYTLLMGACCKAQWWTKALKFWHELKRKERMSRFEPASGDRFASIQEPSDSLRIDAYACTAALQALSIGTGWMQAFALAEDIEKQGLRSNVHIVTTVITAAHRAQKWKLALELATNAKSRNVRANVHFLSALQAAQLAGRMWEDALSLSERLLLTPTSHLKPTPVTYGTYLSACAVGSQWERALACLHRLLPESFSASSLAEEINGENGEWRESSRASGASMTVNPHMASSVLQALSLGGKSERAIDLADELRHAQLRLNLVVFNTLLKACERARRWEYALEVFDNAEREGLRLNVVSLSTVMFACLKAAKLMKVINPLLYRSGCGARRMGIRVFEKMTSKRLVPNEICFNALARLHGIAASWKAALSLLRTMPQGSLRGSVDTYNAVISGCAEAAQWRVALEMIEEMIKSSVSFDLSTVTAVVNACQRAYAWTHALGLLNLPSALNLRWDYIMYDNAIATLVSSQRWEDGLNIFYRMATVSIRRDTVSFNAALFACRQGAKWEVATQLVQQMRDQMVDVDHRTRRHLTRILQNITDNRAQDPPQSKDLGSAAGQILDTTRKDLGSV